MSLLDIDVQACRVRQQRLLEYLRSTQIEMAVISSIEHIQYLVGPRFAWTFQPLAAIRTDDGHVTLVAPERRMPEVHAADDVVPYEAQWLSTLRNDQRQEASKVLAKSLGNVAKVKRWGVEYSCFSRYLPVADTAEFIDLDPQFLQMRRRKDPDELAKMEKAIAGTGRMYEVARQMIRPGVNELDVFNELQSAAVREFDEPLTGTGNDYRCAARGGAPRNRNAQPGELYILDLGPAFRGYFADNARTIAVSDVSEPQEQAWQQIMLAFNHIEANVKPGVSCRQLFEQVSEVLSESPVGVFNHHLGHGIGLFPHEGPHLNPNWNDTFQEGDVFAAEPGLYDPKLNAGMRIENDYLVTENGVRKLTPFPLELKL